MTVTDKIIYQVIKQVLTFMGMLPRKGLNLFSDISGLVWYRLDKRHRTVALENIQTAYPEKFSSFQAEKFAKTVFKNIASIPFETIWFYGKSRQALVPYFTIKGLHHLEKARQKGRGVLLLTCHLGNFELFVAASPTVGLHNIYGIYRKFDFLPLEHLMREMRQRFGMVMIPTGGATGKIDTILEDGGIVGTLFDQNAGWYNGVVTDFFGRPACSKNGLAKIVLRSKAAVVPVFMVKKEDTYVVQFLPEIPLQMTGCQIKDIEINTQNYVTAVELMVRQCPEQYFWVHNRWKTKPFSRI
jgi:Kdo2-lipid IVA lauroyltransferase/acyltransferase